MKKLLALVCVGAVVGLMSGCGITNPVSAPRVTLDNPIGSIAIPATGSGTKTFSGKIAADTIISTVAYSVKKASGATATGVTVIGTLGPSTGNSLNITGTITIASTADSGAYKLVVSATAGPTANVEFPFTLTGGSSGTPVTKTTLTLAGHDNPDVGSGMELDGPSVMKAAEAGPANSGVDIVYTYSDILHAPVLLTPKYVADNNIVTTTWVNVTATPFNKVASTVDFNTITTKEQIMPLYDATAAAANATTGRVQVAAGEVYVVKTDQNAYVLIKINSPALTSSSVGTAEVIVAK